MKKFAMITLLALTFVQNAFAFQVGARVDINPTTATAMVYNRFDRPIVCHISVRGFTQYGQTLNAYMNHVLIHPGMYGYAYVYTNYNNPFMNAGANANCYWY